MTAKKNQRLIAIPFRTEPLWDAFCELVRREAPEASNGAILELALRLASEAVDHVEGVGLLVSPQGPGRPRGDVDMYIPSGRILGPAPETPHKVEGAIPIRAVPEFLRRDRDDEASAA